MKLFNNSIQDFINLISNGFYKICTKIYARMVCISYTIMSNFNFLICTVQQGMVAKYVHKYSYNIFYSWNSSTSTSFKHLQRSTEVFNWVLNKGTNMCCRLKKYNKYPLDIFLFHGLQTNQIGIFRVHDSFSNGSLAFRDLADNLLYLVRIYLCT